MIFNVVIQEVNKMSSRAAHSDDKYPDPIPYDQNNTYYRYSRSLPRAWITPQSIPSAAENRQICLRHVGEENEIGSGKYVNVKLESILTSNISFSILQTVVCKRYVLLPFLCSFHWHSLTHVYYTYT